MVPTSREIWVQDYNLAKINQDIDIKVAFKVSLINDGSISIAQRYGLTSLVHGFVIDQWYSAFEIDVT